MVAPPLMPPFPTPARAANAAALAAADNNPAGRTVSPIVAVNLGRHAYHDLSGTSKRNAADHAMPQRGAKSPIRKMFCCDVDSTNVIGEIVGNFNPTTDPPHHLSSLQASPRVMPQWSSNTT